MKRILFLTTVFLLSALAAAAQSSSSSPLFAVNLPAESALPSAEPQVPQGAGSDGTGGGGGGGAISVFDSSLGEWEAFGGYSFTRFYEIPNSHIDGNGFNMGLNAYPFKQRWIGGDGEFMATFATAPNGQASRFLLGMGGAKVRWTPRSQSLELWAHGLAGTSHFAPKTGYGPQDAMGYELGGGADFGAGAHLALRLEGDMVGTRFFGTAQYSPKLSAGIVFKF